MKEIEIWKDIPNHEGCYQISNLGRVKSLERSVNYGNRRVRGCIKKLRMSPEGYATLIIWVYVNNTKTCHSYIVHRLVAKAFIPNPKNKPHVNHIDGVPSNNNVSNLEWCTRSENITHAFKVLGRYHGNRRKLSDKQVSDIRIKLSEGVYRRPLARMFNVSKSVIDSIASKRHKCYQ